MNHSSNISCPNWFLVFAMPVCVGFINCSSENIAYRITDNGLKINALIHGRFVPKDSLILNSIKIIDVNADHSYQPYIRLWGIGQPGIKTDKIKLDEYLEGWFLLNNDDIALAFMSEHKKAIYIKTTMIPPRQVKLMSKIDPAESPGKRKTFALLLGTNKPLKLKAIMEKEWDAD